MADVNRREFLAAAAAMATACALCGSVAHADDAPAWQRSKEMPPEKFDAGKPDDFAKDTGSDKYAVDHQILITHKDGKLIALTAVCTHKKALLTVDNNQYYCPHHKSRFTLEGDPTPKPDTGRLGPAHDPLVHYAIRINDDHHIIVDTGTSFDKDKWGDAGAFVDLHEK